VSELNYRDLLGAWGVQFLKKEPSVAIEGSPERTASRSVICDTDGSRWVLEQIDAENVERKQQIAQHLQSLYLSGLNDIHPWRETSVGSFFKKVEMHHWMLRPFVEGLPLNRETYLEEPWRVDAMTNFLLQLRDHSSELTGPSFSIANYAEDRMGVWRGRYPEMTQKMESSFGKLQRDFFPIHDQLSEAFCHGDYHPLNMVWGQSSIESVIDWEFCGPKPELYDVALLLGCIGFDDPDHLIKEPALRLIGNLRGTELGSEKSWEHLLGLMATIRYGWMSEWIRRSDVEAREMEIVFIDILVDQREYIQQQWSSFA
jgi:homoserine kinase type II